MLQVWTPFSWAMSEASPQSSSGTERNFWLSISIPTNDQQLGFKSARACDWATRMRKCEIDAPPSSRTPSFAPIRLSQALLVSFGFASVSFNLSFDEVAFDWRIEIMSLLLRLVRLAPRQ